MKIVKVSAEVKSFWLAVSVDGNQKIRCLFIVYKNGFDASHNIAIVPKIFLLDLVSGKKEGELTEKLLDAALALARKHRCSHLFVADRSHGANGRQRRKILRSRNLAKVGCSFSIL